ncbi:hypothetical protein [Thermoactinospora rubra]|uniref:hypothetical protein n=1 Tax=Thermoactinospora rubra TaxID=1088767 RepID=UPI000A1176CA|nr:hypothetical protein [Thermoactinospora rubra]
MVQRLRSRLAALAGAAVFVSGAGLVAAAAASMPALSAAVDPIELDLGSSDLVVPLEKDNEVAFTIKINSPYKANDDLAGVSASLQKPGETTQTSIPLSPTTVPPKPTPYPTPSASPTATITPSLPGYLTFTGSFKITKADKAGVWKLNVTAFRVDTEDRKTFDLQVDDKTSAVSGGVSPAQVQLKTGTDVPVRVFATVKNAKNVYADLNHADGSMNIRVPLYKESDGVYRYTAYMADDTVPGSWYLVIHAERNSEKIEARGMDFTVLAPKGGVAPKAKSRVTIKAPAKVKGGKAFKVYGKAYRGTKGYGGKVLELYFKKKGGKSFVFYGFAKTTSTGVWAKKVKQKADGYWKVVVPGTSKTKKSSATDFVDVR